MCEKRERERKKKTKSKVKEEKKKKIERYKAKRRRAAIVCAAQKLNLLKKFSSTHRRKTSNLNVKRGQKRPIIEHVRERKAKATIF